MPATRPEHFDRALADRKVSLTFMSSKAVKLSISRPAGIITRQKTGSLAMIHFGPDIEAILRQMPATGPLFLCLQSVRCGDRATEFKQRGTSGNYFSEPG